MARCNVCKTDSPLISKELGACLPCIRENPRKALAVAKKAHIKSRIAFGLPEKPPGDPQGIRCNLCVNECRIPSNSIGYCGVRKNEQGKITGVSSERGKASWYHDPLPTNCVADWVCPGGIGAGYPRFAHCEGPEEGYENLAVFFHACSFNRLYCQNWRFKEETFKPHTVSVHDPVADLDEKTSCICFFGGDPTSQIPFSLKAARLCLKKKKERILRICWETNGSMHPKLLDEMIGIALNSGGCIKFDLTGC